MTFDPQTGRHRITTDQARQILIWMYDTSVQDSEVVVVWQADDSDFCWYAAVGDSCPEDPRLELASTTCLTIDDFEVILSHEEVFRRALPAIARSGIAMSDEMIEAISDRHNESGSYFAIEPNAAKPWLYDGVVYAVKSVVPLRNWTHLAPLPGDYVFLGNERHTTISTIHEDLGNSCFRVEDDYGEDFVVRRYEQHDTQLRKAWIDIRVAEAEGDA